MTFQAIKQCAINKDLNRLNQLKEVPDDLNSIDDRDDDNQSKIGSYYLTPAGDLAREGNLEAVEFLRQHGASINCIAFGFALAGNDKMAEEYRVKFKADVNRIAFGFALGGHVKHADSYREQFDADIDEIALGFAMGGYINEAERYRKEGAEVNYIAFGLAKGGYTKYAEIYRTQLFASISYIALGFDVGGFIEKEDEYSKMKQEAVTDLKNYIDSFKDTLLTICSEITYPTIFSCRISHKPPTIPVRVKGFGILDYQSVMNIPETSEGSRKRLHPHYPNVKFEISDITPDLETRDALIEFTLSAQKAKGVSFDNQVTFARREAMKNNRVNQPIVFEDTVRTKEGVDRPGIICPYKKFI